MKSTLIITNNLLGANYSAIQSAKAQIARNNLDAIYFLFDAAYLANKHIQIPTDEFNISQTWSELAQTHGIEIIVCKASAARRGITQDLLKPGFRLGSIGELVASCDLSEQVICQ